MPYLFRTLVPMFAMAMLPFDPTAVAGQQTEMMVRVSEIEIVPSHLDESRVFEEVSMNRVALFFLACVFGGAGGALGSVVGHGFGKTGLWAGGILGGLLASILVARIALGRRWIVRSQYWPTALGTIIGFFAACAVVVNTLSSPVGPVMSTLLIGAGAVLGSFRTPSDAEVHAA
jgi:hypothetical protein